MALEECLKELERCYRNPDLKTMKKLLDEIYRTSSLSLDTISRIGALVEGSRTEDRSICEAYSTASKEEKTTIDCHCFVIAYYLLMLRQIDSRNKLSQGVILLLEYASSIVGGDYDYLGKALEAFNCRYNSLGYFRSNLATSFSIDGIIHLFCNEVKTVEDHASSIDYRNYGGITVRSGRLNIFPTHTGDSLVTAFSACNDGLRVWIDNIREDKLKQADACNAIRIEEFADRFTTLQTKSPVRKVQKVYSAGDRVDIVLCGETCGEKAGSCTLCCRPADGDKQLEGIVLEEELFKGIFTNDLIPYLCKDDCIAGATLESTDGEQPEYSIKEAYRAFAVQAAEKDWKDNRVFEAKALRVREDIRRINWLTAGGYGANSFAIEGVKPGDIRILTIHSIQRPDTGIFINVQEPKYSYDRVDERFSDEDVLGEFVNMTPQVQEEPQEKADGIEESLRSIATILLRQKVYRDSLENLRRLTAARLIARAIGDRPLTEEALARAAYLRFCISFAQNEAPLAIRTGISLCEEQDAVVRLLKNAAGPFNRADLVASLDPEGKETLPGKIAALLLAVELGKSFSDEIKWNRDDIRKKICKLLGVDDRFTEVEAREAGKYGKGELSTLEFKSSYVMRNDGKGPDLFFQGRGEVFGAVCGFLNTNGGTVYVGVKDNGDPITDAGYGIQKDIEWLSANHSSLNQTYVQGMGHGIMKVNTLDRLVLFLNAEKERYFKKSLHSCIQIEPTEDQDAIRITVQPSRYELAMLYEDFSHENGVTYKRDGTSTLPMTEVEKVQRLASLKDISKEMGFIVTLQEAIDKKHKVILKDYASGNSGEVKDRLVVPVNLFYNDENLYAYDLGAKQLKEFRLCRIGSIETDLSNPRYDHVYQPKPADVFRWIGKGRCSSHIKIRMDILAHNCLLEEYSNAKHLSSEELYPDGKDYWILDTHLYGLEAIRRFYLGMADRIEILETEDAERLKKSIREYARKYILPDAGLQGGPGACTE